ncbi:MAG TPA: transferrin receptor-like dimerization domain-containing protein, partial [Acidobacteriaceae bacterium]|nr:transferrin receptor-like dimerization domain-containing protein [Acidobacteriaceae bacterium]
DHPRRIFLHRTIARSLLFTLVAPSLAQSPAPPATLPGYSAETAQKELDWEHRFRAIPDAARAHQNMRFLAAHPHNVGSAAQRKHAEWMVAKYKEWGWDAHIEQFDVLYPTPKTMQLELVGPTHFKASLSETPLPDDPYTHETSTQLPGYNIYSADGDVTAPLIYANYGMLDDYAELERNGISVKGAIVITRYGGGWRGLKPKLAYEHGAVGCIIYSDPADDGYGQNDVLPKGPMRPPQGIQRGSVADTSLYAGDPLTPGIGSVPGSKRLAIKDAQAIMKIPVLPIGYADAQPLLAALDGRTVPASWRGGLPLTYHFGPGPAKVHLKLEFNWGTAPVLDVVATMRGSVEPDVWIVRGNHYDGWVNGADDPISGQSGLLEEARALGELHKQGWNPKRTLIYTAWDGEEPGLLGSTEWAETHAAELTAHAALYVNSDESNRGFLNASGSHSLQPLINDVAKDIPDPESKSSVWKRQQAALIVRGSERPGRRAVDPNSDQIPIGAPGSGSDFAAFVDHLGIASMEIGFGGEDRGGTYHSAYDTPWYIEHFGDKHSTYGKVLADTAGTLVMRFADADVLPYDFRTLASTLKGYTTELKALQAQLTRESTTRARNLQLGLYALAADPEKPVGQPGPLPPPPTLDFTALDHAIDTLGEAGVRLHTAEDAAIAASPASLKKANAELATAERRFLSPAGLPRRPWVENVLYAPGWFTGYGAKTMPGVREALEDGRYTEAAEQLVILTKCIEDEAAFLNSIAAELTPNSAGNSTPTAGSPHNGR